MNITLKIVIFLLLSTANILGLLGSVILALFAFFWFPIKRALFSSKSEDEDDLEAIEENTAAEKTK